MLVYMIGYMSLLTPVKIPCWGASIVASYEFPIANYKTVFVPFLQLTYQNHARTAPNTRTSAEWKRKEREKIKGLIKCLGISLIMHTLEFKLSIQIQDKRRCWV